MICKHNVGDGGGESKAMIEKKLDRTCSINAQINSTSCAIPPPRHQTFALSRSYTQNVNLFIHRRDSSHGQRSQRPPSNHPKHSQRTESPDFLGGAQGHLWHRMGHDAHQYHDQ